MLDVERSVNIDASIEQLEHVLVAFRMPRSRRIGVRELIDHRQARMPCQDGVEIHFLSVVPRYSICERGMIGILRATLRFLCVRAFRQCRPQPRILRLFLPRRLQHGVGLADARRHSEENLQLPAGRRRFFRFICARNHPDLAVRPLPMPRSKRRRDKVCISEAELMNTLFSEALRDVTVLKTCRRVPNIPNDLS